MKIRTIALCLAILTLALTATSCTGNGTPSVTDADTDAATSPNTDTDATTDGDSTDTTQPEETTSNEAAPESIEFDRNVTITEENGSAKVTANGDLSYTATGYKALDGNRFVINRDFTMTLDTTATTAADFNRFSICYVSDQPLKGTVTYTEGSATKTDSFFLEAGENTFSCLTTSYLDGIKGKDIASMTFSTCNGEDARFILCLLRTYDYPVYTSTSEDTYFISNSRFRLGIRLSWGGGINYLRDSKSRSAMDGVSNLINQYDTGRLVQQSYYGTYEEGDYKAGEFNNSKWCYNPVQGGDKYQNHSRIIDVVVKEHSVYVKSQPQDWSLNNHITPSYMENTYTLYEDRIRVDNRFVDFSGMTHRYAHQELPAFYTLSCFDRFSWYDGYKGWTGDTLSHRDDLNFWGDPAYNADCTFRIRNSNTETWCAWTSSTADYGIGLYVPNVDTFLAGRHSYNGSTSAKSGATNYVAPLNLLCLVSYEPIEYSYLITTGSLSDIRETFRENKDFATNASLHKNYQSQRVEDEAVITPGSAVLNLEEALDRRVIFPTNNAAAAYDAAEGAMKLTVTGADPSVYFDLAVLGQIATDAYETLVIEYKIPSGVSQTDYCCDLFICAGTVTAPDGNYRVRADLKKTGDYVRLEIPVSELSYWMGSFNGFRFDFFDSAAVGDTMLVRTVALE